MIKKTKVISSHYCFIHILPYIDKKIKSSPY